MIQDAVTMLREGEERGVGCGNQMLRGESFQSCSSAQMQAHTDVEHVCFCV
jgi:hypothetical protein